MRLILWCSLLGLLLLIAAPASATMIDGILISGEDVSWSGGFGACNVPTEPVPMTVLFLSGEDVRYDLPAPLAVTDFSEDLRADFNGNGMIDWGDVVKLAYFYWGKITSLYA